MGDPRRAARDDQHRAEVVRGGLAAQRPLPGGAALDHPGRHRHSDGERPRINGDDLPSEPDDGLSDGVDVVQADGVHEERRVAGGPQLGQPGGDLVGATDHVGQVDVRDRDRELAAEQRRQVRFGHRGADVAGHIGAGQQHRVDQRVAARHHPVGLRHRRDDDRHGLVPDGGHHPFGLGADAAAAGGVDPLAEVLGTQIPQNP